METLLSSVPLYWISNVSGAKWSMTWLVKRDGGGGGGGGGTHLSLVLGRVLKEQILHNVIAESRAIIIHNNDMGPAFTLDQVLYYLDNDKIYYQDNRDGVLDDKTEFEIFNGNVLPGNHLVSVELVYRGNGTLFSYIDGYTFKIRSSYTFYAAKGRITRLKVVGYERGGITTDLEQKPYVRYEVQQFRYSRENLDKAKDGALEGGESED